jgi:sporulation protein YlmC with PRC-barrel domain
MHTESGTLMRLGDSDQMLADPAQDIRGHKVIDRDGTEIGKVDDLLVDNEHQKVRMLRVEHGGLLGIGATPLFLPVDTVEHVEDDKVMIGRSQVQVVGAPEYDPELVDRDERMAELYDYYGYAPYWAPGYIPPARGLFR